MDPFQAKLGQGMDRGDAIFLRPLLPQDINDFYVGWFRDERVTRYLEAKNISTGDALAHLVDGFVRDAWYMYAIVDRARGVHIGNVKIGPIKRRHQTSDIAIFIGDVESWGKGFATLAVSLVTQIAFEQLGLRKLHAGVIEGNDGSVRAFQNAGWHVEAELPHDVVHEGQAKNRILLGVLNPTYRGDASVEQS